METLLDLAKLRAIAREDALHSAMRLNDCLAEFPDYPAAWGDYLDEFGTVMDRLKAVEAECDRRAGEAFA